MRFVRPAGFRVAGKPDRLLPAMILQTPLELRGRDAQRDALLETVKQHLRVAIVTQNKQNFRSGAAQSKRV